MALRVFNFHDDVRNFFITPELRSDDARGDALHCERRGVSVAQHVESRRRFNRGDPRGLSEGTLLMRWSPRFAISP